MRLTQFKLNQSIRMRQMIKWIFVVLILVGCSSRDNINEKEVITETHNEVPKEVVVETTLDLVKGKSLFMTCIACHGEKAQGNKVLGAPTLVNQENWYLERQLSNFKNGVRGYDPKDIRGMQMAPMAKLLIDNSAISNVVGYIKSLPSSKPVSTIEGDIENGKAFYNAICAACHGADGKGNEALNAPRLVGVDDWYLIDQYKNFRDGLRGDHKDDTFGSQMKMMANTLPTDESMNNVMAYIQSL